MKARGKNLIFKRFSELRKIWKCRLGFSNILKLCLLWIEKNLEVYTAETNISKSKFWIYGWIRWSCILIEASMLKIRWGMHMIKDGHILNLTWRIAIFHYRKFYKLINELGKIFSTGENGMNPLGILPIPKNVWSKGPDWRYLFLAYLYKSITSEWTKKTTLIKVNELKKLHL